MRISTAFISETLTDRIIGKTKCKMILMVSFARIDVSTVEKSTYIDTRY